MQLREKNKLLYAKAAFGISLEDYDHPRPIPEVVASLFPPVPQEPLIVITEEEWAKSGPAAMRPMDEMQRRAKQEIFISRMKDVNNMWQNAMVTTKYPLLEKMTLFWHGHFATRLDNPYHDQKLLNIFRQNALGNFGDMLRQVSKNEIMVMYLNNKQNVKDHPNENFAREVMELFTLGRDNYTEHDVREGARAFTGWSIDRDGNFLVRDEVHDTGNKTFLGKTGNYNGDDILTILLEHKQTAHFVTQKIYRFFVSDEIIDQKRIDALAEDFYKSNYDISALLKSMFTADWFYDESLAGSKVKSPMDLLVGYQRIVPMSFESDRTLIQLQRALGQHLFNPPNVAGWLGGKFWINSSSLTLRMKMADALLSSRELNPNLTSPLVDKNRAQKIEYQQQDDNIIIAKIAVDWSKYIAYWSKYSHEELPGALAGYLLHMPVADEQMKVVAAFADSSTNDAYIKSLTTLIMELPEYQLM